MAAKKPGPKKKPILVKFIKEVTPKENLRRMVLNKALHWELALEILVVREALGVVLQYLTRKEWIEAQKTFRKNIERKGV